MWGRALSLDDYLKREAYLCTVPLAKDSGITHWILTDSNAAADQRPVLSSCESLRKRAIACAPGGEVKDGIAHGVASVFTNPEFRGAGYAGRMMRDLNVRLGNWQAEEHGGKSLFSVLYSDIGDFYASKGWAAFESTHLSFKNPTGTPAHTGSPARRILQSDVAELCALDERLLRERVRARAASTGRTCVAILPDRDQIQWHLQREGFVTQQVFGRQPAVHGGVWGEAGGRVWALWTRGYHGGAGTTEGNTLHVLRLVAEDEGVDAQQLADGFAAVMALALREAAEWSVGEVHVWNPGPGMRRAAEMSGIVHELVVREKDSIASLAWYGEGDVKDLDWVANEKFAWC
jgi:hypothetical protein